MDFRIDELIKQEEDIINKIRDIENTVKELNENYSVLEEYTNYINNHKDINKYYESLNNQLHEMDSYGSLFKTGEKAKERNELLNELKKVGKIKKFVKEQQIDGIKYIDDIDVLDISKLVIEGKKERKIKLKNKYIKQLENVQTIYQEELDLTNKYEKDFAKLNDELDNYKNELTEIEEMGKFISKETSKRKEEIQIIIEELREKIYKLDKQKYGAERISDENVSKELLEERLNKITKVITEINNSFEKNDKKETNINEKEPSIDKDPSNLTHEESAKTDEILGTTPTKPDEINGDDFVKPLIDQEKDKQPMQPSITSMIDDKYTNNVDQVQPKSILSQNNNENKYTSLANLMFQQEEKKVDGNQQNDNLQKKNQTLDSQQIARMDEILGKTPTSLSRNNTTAPNTGDYGKDIFDILENFDSGEPALQGQDKPVPDEELNRILFSGSTGIDSTMPLNIPPIVKQEETPIQETDKIKPIAKKVKRKVPKEKAAKRIRNFLKKAIEYFTQYDEETDYEINLGMERGDEMYGRRKGL